MRRLVIVEDDFRQAALLEQMILRHPQAFSFAVESVTNTCSAELLFRNGQPPDILVTDIDFGPENPNGIDLVNRLVAPGGTQVIYVTGFVEYCTAVYKTEHTYFLTKPVSELDLRDALDKALSNLAVRHTPLVVRESGRVLLVDPQTIDFVESDRRKVRIYMGSRTLEEYASLAVLLEGLPATFVQCHKSFLVNMERIVELRADSVVLNSGEVVPISQKRRRVMKDAYLAFLRSKM